MILLLNNLHCPCGRRKELEELKENYGSFSAILNCKNCPIKQYRDNKETFYFSNKIEGMGEFNGDIELFTEVDESYEINGFVEDDLQKEDSYNEHGIEEIEEILTSGRNIIPDLMDDDVFGISFDKR
ncbi:hypothetical protein M0812_09714 [Anaeramoeba flamelloides]|uniref:DNL-type domain-containing protein n=1 Tax=Anaeramoeba flamelloides TaxID=1746091 RepID=A0AAV7ZTZ5_9EUKA|nr:hypothetical protein M0812_09714 [Anaeramoeba flamelloides]